MMRLIVAVSSNGVIGRGGRLPWKRIAEDQSWLLAQISGGVVVLGRRSFEETSGPLPGVRATVVVTSQPDRIVPPPGTTVVTAASLTTALQEAKRLAGGDDEAAASSSSSSSSSSFSSSSSSSSSSSNLVWICGGEAIYRESLLLPRTELLYLTRVHEWCEGDTTFPSCWRSFFPETLWSQDGADENYRYTFSILGRDGSAGRSLAPPKAW